MTIIQKDNFYLIDHPFIEHKLSIMRDKNTSTFEFRALLKEISLLMGYEITHDLPMEAVEIETPLEPMKARKIKGAKPAIIPVLRAGLGMVDGLIQLIPGARVGHVGLYRDEETRQPVEYFKKFPKLSKRLVIICDPMLATGNSAAYATKLVIEAGAKPHNIRFISLLASPEGIKVFKKQHPSVELYTAALDNKLNDRAYILPGLGDAGDRLYGTK